MSEFINTTAHKDLFNELHAELLERKKIPHPDNFYFFCGMSDCENGIPWQAVQSESYDKGYAYRYELEQMQSRGFN